MISEYNLDKKLNQFAPLGEASEFGVFENGGKGSGNFGHSGRPGERGGSAPKGTSYKEGDTFEKHGETFIVERGPNGLEGVSADRKIVTMLPSEESRLKEEREKLNQETCAYEQAAYEDAVMQYESDMRSFERQIRGYEESNASLERIKRADRPFEADPIDLVITQNNRHIEDLKEQARKATTKRAAKSAQFHYGAGELKQNGDEYSVFLGNTTKTYPSIQEAQNYRAGVLGAYKSIAIAPSNVKKLAGRYEVVYDGTDLGVGYSHSDKSMAKSYSDGWNTASRLTDKIRRDLLKAYPQFQ